MCFLKAPYGAHSNHHSRPEKSFPLQSAFFVPIRLFSLCNIVYQKPLRCCFSDPRINSASVLSLGYISSLIRNQKKRASSAVKQMTPIYNIKQSHHRVQISSFKDGAKTGFPVYSKRSLSSACLLKLVLLLVFASIFNIFIPLSPPD